MTTHPSVVATHYDRGFPALASTCTTRTIRDNSKHDNEDKACARYGRGTPIHFFRVVQEQNVHAKSSRREPFSAVCLVGLGTTGRSEEHRCEPVRGGVLGADAGFERRRGD